MTTEIFPPAFGQNERQKLTRGEIWKDRRSPSDAHVDGIQLTIGYLGILVMYVFMALGGYR